MTQTLNIERKNMNGKFKTIRFSLLETVKITNIVKIFSQTAKTDMELLFL